MFDKRKYFNDDISWVVISYSHGEGIRIYEADTKKQASKIYDYVLNSRDWGNGATLSIKKTKFDSNLNRFYISL